MAPHLLDNALRLSGRISMVLVLVAFGVGGCDGGTGDADGDGYPDNVDFYPYGQDTIDTDRDGIANAYDRDPYNVVQVTPSSPQTVTPSSQTGPSPPAERDSDSDGIPDQSDPYPLGEDRYLDSDGDGTPDRVDPEPHLPSDGDTDGDGIANGQDAAPLYNNDYDLDGHKNSTDLEPYNHDEY
jgi:hypothetical protein